MWGHLTPPPGTPLPSTPHRALWYQRAMVVPHERIDPETLQRLIADFVTRDGTDYGLEETPLETKVLQVRRLLERGEAAIVFDDKTQSIDIVLRENLKP